MSDGDGRQGVKRLRQHENDTTATDSKSFTPLTPTIKVEAKTGDLLLASVTASLTT